MRKEIAKFQVKCVNHESGCSWEGLVSELAGHWKGCDFAKDQCPDCQEWVLRTEVIFLSVIRLCCLQLPIQKFSCAKKFLWFGFESDGEIFYIENFHSLAKL